MGTGRGPTGNDEVGAVLSPSGSRIAVTGRRGEIMVLATATGRLVRTYGEWPPDGLWWLGGDGIRGGQRPLLIWAIFGCWSLGCGLELDILGRDDLATVGISGRPVAALREGLVLVDGTTVYVYGGDVDAGFELRRMPRTAPFRVVADVVNDRLFAISSAGLVARIDHVARRPKVSYHRVDLNGRPFEAAWAGDGRIALWGQDGLGTIDTRTWRTRAVAPSVTDVVATPFGLAAWSDDAADGLTVYRPDGGKRLRVLPGKRVHQARAVGGFLYVEADGARYSVDLRTGKVFGPLADNAAVVTPSFVSIP